METCIELLTQALEDEIWWIRMAAVRALGTVKIGNAWAVDSLIQALGDEDWRVRWETVRALGELGAPNAVEPLIQALGDESQWVRLGVVNALGKFSDDPRAMETLAQVLLQEESWGVRWMAAQVLGTKYRK